MIPVSAAGWEADNSASLNAAPAAAEQPKAAAPAAQAAEDAVADEFRSFRDEVVRLVNEEREQNGLNTLTVSVALEDMADLRAQDAAAQFLHQRPDGTALSAFFTAQKLEYSVAAENLAYGFSDASKLVTAWMQSESHRANLLSDKLTYIGVGCWRSESGKLYTASLFYTPKTAQEPAA